MCPINKIKSKMDLSTLLKIEYIKFFRRSNVLFFFLFLYLIITPIGRGLDMMQEGGVVNATDFYIGIAGSFSIFGMLLMAIFIVNSTGNEFNEGSYRKILATGLSKKDFFTGKFLLIIIAAFFVIFFSLLIYFAFGTLAIKASLYELINGINPVSILNQFTALFLAGIFGLSFIAGFRNRTIGLVFFPFWVFAELIVFLLDVTETARIPSAYFPGVAGWSLYNSSKFDSELFIIAAIFILIFLICAWSGLILREERSP